MPDRPASTKRSQFPTPWRVQDGAIRDARDLTVIARGGGWHDMPEATWLRLAHRIVNAVNRAEVGEDG